MNKTDTKCISSKKQHLLVATPAVAPPQNNNYHEPPLTVESIRALAHAQALEWVNNVSDLRKNAPLMQWRDGCRDEIHDLLPTLTDLDFQQKGDLLNAWTQAFDAATDIKMGALHDTEHNGREGTAIVKNPYFHDIECAPSQLGQLLRDLPGHFPVTHILSADERFKVKAVISHAYNANFTLMSGIEAIGRLLFSAANNPEFPPSTDVLEDLGGLIRHLAVEAQFMQEQRDGFQSVLDTDGKRAAPAGPATKRGAK